MDERPVIESRCLLVRNISSNIAKQREHGRQKPVCERI